jgi:hypothetical protein
MPCGLNRVGVYRNGFKVVLPLVFGNSVTWPTPNPAHWGNPIPSSGTNINFVTWITPNPAHFGNAVSK